MVKNADKQLALGVSHSTDFVVMWHILRMGNHSALFAIGNDSTNLCSLLRFMKYAAKCEWAVFRKLLKIYTQTFFDSTKTFFLEFLLPNVF